MVTCVSPSPAPPVTVTLPLGLATVDVLVAVLVAVLEEVGLPPFLADLTCGLSFDMLFTSRRKARPTWRG